MSGINSGNNGGRLIGSFNLGGQGCQPGSGKYHIYDDYGNAKTVYASTYNHYMSSYNDDSD